eukprot:12900383-Prorocentrum_lima.AAC.1
MDKSGVADGFVQVAHCTRLLTAWASCDASYCMSPSRSVCCGLWLAGKGPKAAGGRVSCRADSGQ